MTTPRPATPSGAEALAGLLDLFDGELPPPQPGRRYEVATTIPGSACPVMVIGAGERDLLTAVRAALGKCRELDGFEITVRPA